MILRPGPAVTFLRRAGETVLPERAAYVALAIAHGHTTYDAIMAATGIRSRSVVAMALADLDRHDLITRHPGLQGATVARFGIVTGWSNAA